MKIRNVLFGSVAGVVFVSGLTGVATRAAVLVPYASGVSIKLVEPSAIATDGAYEVSVSEDNPSPTNCGFYLSRYTTFFGGWESLGAYTGTSTTDLVQDYYGLTEYQVIPYDCQGNEDTDVPGSVGFFPTTEDQPELLLGGSQTVVSSPKYYGGSALEILGGVNVAAAAWNAEPCYNLGVVIGTGPLGGVATVYVQENGGSIVKKGTIDFYSKKTGGKNLAFKFGTNGENTDTVYIYMTKKGKGGGSLMWFDAGVENASS